MWIQLPLLQMLIFILNYGMNNMEQLQRLILNLNVKRWIIDQEQHPLSMLDISKLVLLMLPLQIKLFLLILIFKFKNSSINSPVLVLMIFPGPSFWQGLRKLQILSESVNFNWMKLIKCLPVKEKNYSKMIQMLTFKTSMNVLIKI